MQIAYSSCCLHSGCSTRCEGQGSTHASMWAAAATARSRAPQLRVLWRGAAVALPRLAAGGAACAAVGGAGVALLLPAAAGTDTARCAAAAPTGSKGQVTTPSGLKYYDVRIGDGPSPQPGDIVQVHYTGRIYEKHSPLYQWEVFDSSRGTGYRQMGQPLEFKVGKGEVIKGWDEGILTMRVGGKRNLIVPPSL